MSKAHDPLAAKLVAAALEFHRLRLWLELEQDTAFLIRMPDDSDPIVAMVMGQGGEEFGLALHCGRNSIESARRLMLRGDDEPPSLAEGTVHLSLSFERLESILVEGRTILVAAGFAARREALAPLFITAPSTGRPRFPNRSEMRLFTRVLNTVIRARAVAPLEAGRIESDRDLFLLRRIEDPGQPPRVERGRETLPPIDPDLLRQIEAAMEKREDLDEPAVDGPPTPVTEPKTVEEWKAVEMSVWTRLQQSLFSDRNHSKRACAEFFGDLDVGIRMLRDRQPEAPAAFCEWWAANWRDTASSPTAIERWLPRASSPAVRRLLDERRRRAPRIYRVEATDPNSMRVNLVDVASGEKHTLLDRGISASANLGIILPMRLIETDVGTFGTLAGPPMRAFDFDDALTFLDELGLSSIARQTGDRPELFGRLFAWQLEQQELRSSPPQLQNTDGDPLVLHAVTFSFTDRAAVVATLAAHREIEHDESQDAAAGVDLFVWLRTTAKGMKALGGPTVYGRIEVKATEMTVEVNSDRRLKLARKMLESIRGVKLVRSEVKSLESVTTHAKPTTGTADSAPPNDPAILEALRARLHERNMAWLDSRVPMLGNKTPRAVARTKEGRERVAIMIRTMPAICGPGGISIEPPRAEMLREIGIEDDSKHA